MKIDLEENKNYSNPASAFMSMMGGGEPKGSITQLPIEQLVPYPKQKTFRRYRQEKLIELSNSIKNQGILSPVIVRPIEKDGQSLYQILAGHSRTEAAKMAGFSQIPCIIKDVDDKTADEIFVYTNLNQREKLLPSEKAAAYKLLMDSVEDEECPLGTAEEIAEQKNESRRQIFRYLRLNNLIQPFLDQVDNDVLAIRAGVNISYFNEKSQYLLHDYAEDHKIKLSLKHTETLRKKADGDELTYSMLNEVLKKPVKKKTSIKLPLDEIGVYFGDKEDEEVIQQVIEIIKEHFNDNY